MNLLTIIGNITRDPKLRTVNTANGPVNVCDFSVAVNDRRQKDENGQPKATFFNCTAWRGLADVVAKFAPKGTKVAVTGSVSCRTYQANDGTTKASLDVVVDQFEFVSGGNRQEAAPAETVPAAQSASNFTPVDNDTLPF